MRCTKANEFFSKFKQEQEIARATTRAILKQTLTNYFSEEFKGFDFACRR